MCAWRPWPYAAKAIIQHDWVANILSVWVTFKFAMDQDVKPAHNLWLCLVDGVPKAVNTSAWQDEWTILLKVTDIFALPGKVTLEYEGPSEDLRITWGKQWEPWGPILSIRVPYLWEGILVVDTVNKRVGIQPGLPAAAALGYAFTIVSPDGTQQTGILHDDVNTQFRTTKGKFDFQTDEGTETDTYVRISGKGGGIGRVWIYDQDKAEYLNLRCHHGGALLSAGGSSPVLLSIQREADVPISMFDLATEGETEKSQLHGWKTGDTEQRQVDLQISPNANNTALWSGVGDYVFDGNIRAAGRLVSDTLTHSAAGPTDNLDVSGVNTVFIDCSLNDVVIGGFVGGVIGQTLQVVKTCAAVQDVTLEHNEPHAFQKIFLHAGLDETLRGEYGGWTLKCNGTSWFDISHSKHV